MPKLNEILGEESFKQLPEEIRKKYKDIDLVDSSNYVEKKELETANSSIKEYKKQLKDRDKQLNDLKDKAKDSEELSQEIEKLKADNEKTTKDYEAKLNKITFDRTLDKALDNYSVKDKEIVKKILDKDKLKQDGEDIIGLKEQMEIMQGNCKYLFEEEQPGGTGSIGGGSSSVIDNDEKLSLGARLAKERTEAIKVTEAQNKFFS